MCNCNEQHPDITCMSENCHCHDDLEDTLTVFDKMSNRAAAITAAASYVGPQIVPFFGDRDRIFWNCVDEFVEFIQTGKKPDYIS
jgi:hypothetical protein